MADSVWLPIGTVSGETERVAADVAGHPALVRITHWITALCFVLLLVTGVEILLSHPRFYWGETGNVNTPPLFQIPVPASRASVPTGYGYTLPDQNGWSRALHFQSAWLLVFAGLSYAVYGFGRGHFRQRLLPKRTEVSVHSLTQALNDHWRIRRLRELPPAGYNVLQRLAYLSVIFGLVPLVIWSGLAMSPGLTSAFPFLVATLGGQQSARTVHFFVSAALLIFTLVHVAMVALTGFRVRMRAMITGHIVSAAEGSTR